MHYVYNKEGACAFFALSDPYQLKRYVDKAIKAGAKPSKKIGGVEMFDVSVLMNPEEYKVKNTIDQSPTRTKVQLCFSF